MTQESLDKIKLSQDTSLEAYKRFQIEKGSAFIVNGSMAVVGGTGSGKTSLVSKLVRLYHNVLNPTIFYFHGGDGMDQTFAMNTKGVPIISISSKPSQKTERARALEIQRIEKETSNLNTSEKFKKTKEVKVSPMESFIRMYAKIKKTLIEFLQLVQVPGYWSENLTVLKKELDGANMVRVAEEYIKKYREPTNIEGVDLGPIIISKGKSLVVAPSLMIFDDLTQLGSYTGQYANQFLKEITSNTRHFANTSIFGMQRYTFLQPNVRKQINTWALGYGVTLDDMRTMIGEIVIPRESSGIEVIEEYESLEKYEFLLINAEFDILSVLKVNL